MRQHGAGVAHFCNFESETGLYREMRMNQRILKLFVLLNLMLATEASAQGKEKGGLGANPLPIGAEGVQWYTTWETAKAEAARSKRPIFFMAAAHETHGICGVF